MAINRLIKENKEIYKDIIKSLAKLCENIEISENPFDIFNTFNYMCLNGYLSFDKNYSFNITKGIFKLDDLGYIPIDFEGMVLLSGYGVCRHTTDFLRHLFCKLGYNSSQIFVYNPLLKINVINPRIDFTKEDLNKYLDNIYKNINLFSKRKEKYLLNYNKATVEVIYLPSDAMVNHTMNIIKDKSSLKIHIFDTTYQAIGKKLKNNCIKLISKNYYHLNYVEKIEIENKYCKTNYDKGLSLYKRYNTENDYESKLDKDLLKIVSEDFYQCNKDKYYTVYENQKRLIKKLSDNSDN